MKPISKDVVKDRTQMRHLSSFFFGIVVGVYLDQTHRVPNVEKWVKMGIKKVSDWEERSRK